MGSRRDAAGPGSPAYGRTADSQTTITDRRRPNDPTCRMAGTEAEHIPRRRVEAEELSLEGSGLRALSQVTATSAQA